MEDDIQITTATAEIVNFSSLSVLLILHDERRYDSDNVLLLTTWLKAQRSSWRSLLPLSLGGDAAATALKATRSGIGGTTNPYGRGLNFFFRHTADASVKGSLVKFGTRATPIVSGIGAFTFGYNAAVAVQCGVGIIE